MHTLQVEGVSFFLQEGFEPLPDQSGITNGSIVIACTHLPKQCSIVADGFNEANLGERNLRFSAKSHLSVGGHVCEVVRYWQLVGDIQFSKWAVFYPIAGETKLFIVTCDGEMNEVDEVNQVRAVFANVEFNAHSNENVGTRSFEYQTQPPFQLAHETNKQLILTENGVFPLDEPSDALISLTEIPMRLLRQQFHPYMGKRLESISAIKETIQIAELSPFVFAIKGEVNLDGLHQCFHARYFFLPRLVINAEAFLREAVYEKHLPAIQQLFGSILPHEAIAS